MSAQMVAIRHKAPDVLFAPGFYTTAPKVAQHKVPVYMLRIEKGGKFTLQEQSSNLIRIPDDQQNNLKEQKK